MLAALPGIREIRSALAGGYLWIVFVWLILDPSLGEGDFDAGPYSSAQHLGQEVGPLALGIGVTFVAYLIGTGANELRGLVSKLYLRARQSANASLSAEERAEFAEEVRERNRRSRARLRTQWRRLTQISFRSEGQERRSRGSLPRELQSAIDALGEMLRPASELVLGGIATGGRIILDTTSLSGDLATAIAALLSRIGADPYKPYLSHRGVQTMKRYLDRCLPNLSEDAPGVADVIADFPVLRSRLIHSSPDTVSEIDRLNAEADFRSAIVLPLMAIAGVFGFEVSVVWFLTWPFLLALRMTARQRRYEAGELMADALVQKVITAPSVETFLSNDQRKPGSNGERSNPAG